MLKKLIGSWLVLLALVIIYFLSTFGKFPEKLAVHFDAFGNPNGFQTKALFQSTFLSLVFITNGVFAVLFLVIGRLPTQLMNIPNKQYWLSKPELKDEFFKKLQAIPLVFGIFINLVFLITEQVIIQANIPDGFIKISGTFGVAIIFLGMGFMLFFLIRIFTPLKGG